MLRIDAGIITPDVPAGADMPTAGAGGAITTPIPYDGSITSGQTVVSANSMVLPSGASSVNNFYVGFDIIVSRTMPNGTVYTQKKRVSGYSGTLKTLFIEDVWDAGYEPKIGDTFRFVLAYPDARISINPVMQVCDYVTAKGYGRGLNPEVDLSLGTWMSSARICDSKSDVSLKLTASATMTADAIYSLTSSGNIIWRGIVRNTVTSKYVNFTKVLGKITNRWTSWKLHNIGDIIYTDDNKFYQVTVAGVFTTKPTHTTGTVGNLTKLASITLTKESGTGPATVLLDITTNPVIALNSDGEEVSGYSLYDADSVNYFRRLGWDEHSQRSATLYQTNFTIDTSAPMFDNINMMTEHYNGIFSYSQGKYTMAVEEAETDIIYISENDIIGKIKINDSGNSSSYNSVTVSYEDPGNNFEARNISLFNSKFLDQDRNVPKKGNIAVAGMTNYYNVRLLADTYLKKSRFGLTIDIDLFPEFIELIPGSVIGITNKRYNWNPKLFRVDTLTINKNGSIGIQAKEYYDDFYSLTNMNKTRNVGLAGATKITAIPSPSNLKATNTTNSNEIKDGILLSWQNAAGLTANVQTEIYSSDTSVSSLIATTINANTITTSVAHGLQIGSAITAENSGYGLTKGVKYFVKIKTATTFTLSETLNGVTLALTNATGLNFSFSTFILSGTVSYPENSFLHTFPNITESTIKYYRIRYKTVR